MAGKLVGDRSLADSECLWQSVGIPYHLACDFRHHGTFINRTYASLW